jgi:riboflavin synthase alpha subunit
MKLTLTTIAAVLAAAALAHAAPPTAITNYYANAVITSATFADAGDTGLSVSNVYICLPVSSLTNAEFTASMVTNDVRPFVSAIVQQMQNVQDAAATSNRFATYIVTRTVAYSATALSRNIYRAIDEQQTISVTPSYPAE